MKIVKCKRYNFAVIVIIRYLSLLEYFWDKRIVVDNTTHGSHLITAPFNLTQRDGRHMINFDYFPLSFSENCRRESSHHLQLLVVVLSSPGKRLARDAIRTLWASKEQSRGMREGKAKVYFIVGDGMRARAEMREEMAEHDDIIVIDVKDTYMNLVYKVFSILHIAADLCPASFTLKVDEDVVFNIDRFLDGIHKYFFPEKADIYCHVWHNMLPKRDHSDKWYISTEQWPGEFYPDFCAGPAYVLTRKAAKKILSNTHLLPDIQVEDVLITGFIGEKAGVNRVAYPAMFHRWAPYHRKCDKLADGTPALIAKHHFKTYGAMRQAWQRISAPSCP